MCRSPVVAQHDFFLCAAAHARSLAGTLVTVHFNRDQTLNKMPKLVLLSHTCLHTNAVAMYKTLFLSLLDCITFQHFLKKAFMGHFQYVLSVQHGVFFQTAGLLWVFQTDAS